MISYKSPAILLCAVLTLGADSAGYPGQTAGSASTPAVAPLAVPLTADVTMDPVGDVTDEFAAFAIRRSSGSLRSVTDRPETVTLLAKGVTEEADIKKYGIEMPTEVAEQSKLAADMISDGIAEEPIPMPNVEQDILEKVVEYMSHHAPSKNGPAADIIKPLKSTNLLDCGVDEWDNAYINVPQEQLFKIILAANFMDIKPLLDLACAKVASMIKGKDVDAIRKEFNIVNDFTPEEEKQIREENRWAEGGVGAAPQGAAGFSATPAQ